MGDLIRPKIQVVTKDGECSVNITIDLNINLNNAEINKKPETEEEDDKTIWAIPTFSSNEKVKFGKKKEE